MIPLSEIYPTGPQAQVSRIVCPRDQGRCFNRSHLIAFRVMPKVRMPGVARYSSLGRPFRTYPTLPNFILHSVCSPCPIPSECRNVVPVWTCSDADEPLMHAFQETGTLSHLAALGSLLLRIFTHKASKGFQRATRRLFSLPFGKLARTWHSRRRSSEVQL